MWWARVAILATSVVAAGACGGESGGERSVPRTPASSAAGMASASLGSGGTGTGTSAGSGGTERSVTSAAGGGTNERDRANAGAVSGAGGTGEPLGGNGGAGRAIAGAGAIGMGDASGGTAGNGGSANGSDEGQGGEQASNGTCSCAWRTPPCNDGRLIYAGAACPPIFDEARRVANWPLGGPLMEGVPFLHGYYEECDDGSRAFIYSQCDAMEQFAFDASGELVDWNESAQACISGAAGAPSTSSRSCSTCDMRAEPGGEGTSCFPRGLSNGPTPACMVDADGNWLMPGLCDN